MVSPAMKLMEKGKKAAQKDGSGKEIKGAVKVSVSEIKDTPSVTAIKKMTADDLVKCFKKYEFSLPVGWEEMILTKKREVLRALLYPVNSEDAPESEPETMQSDAAKDVAESAKGKEIAKQQEQEVLAPDPISNTETEMDKLTEATAPGMVSQLLEDIEFNHFRIGGVLHTIRANGWFGDHDNFQSYVEANFMHYRKAMHFIKIYEVLTTAKVKWADVSGVGWTKLKELLPVITAENAAGWAKVAMSMSTLQLIEHVDKAKKAEVEEGGEEAQVSEITTMTFKCHADQRKTILEALDKAKEESSTDVNTVALEHICIAFTAGPPAAKTEQTEVSLKQIFAGIKKDHPDLLEAIQMIFTDFEKVYPEVELTVKLPE